MRIIELGNKEIELRATPLALLYYRQEFNADLMADFISLEALVNLEKGDYSGLDTVKILQLIYAMNKASHVGKPFPKFEAWLGNFEQLNLADAGWILGVIEEARDGFLSSGKPAATAAKPNGTK